MQKARSIDQQLNSALFHSIEACTTSLLSEHREQALDSAHRVVLPGSIYSARMRRASSSRANPFPGRAVQTELLAQQNRELKQRPADSFQSNLLRHQPAPVARRKGLLGLLPSLRDKDGAVAWGGRKPVVCRPTAPRLTLRVCEKSLCNAVAASKTLA